MLISKLVTEFGQGESCRTGCKIESAELPHLKEALPRFDGTIVADALEWLRNHASGCKVSLRSWISRGVETVVEIPDRRCGSPLWGSYFGPLYDARMMCGTRSKTEIVEPTWVGEVIHFWFEELGEAHWFTKSDHIDARIRDRFLRLHEQLVRHDGLGVTAPRQFLALVVVLDQFSRNLYRGNPRAFSADSIARQLSRTAIEQGFDITMKREERYFLYLPFEHSEDREDQTLALNLIKRLANEEWTRYAMAHKVVIDRFGRFPHRNAVLNRLSTADEIAFLEEPMRSF